MKVKHPFLTFLAVGAISGLLILPVFAQLQPDAAKTGTQIERSHHGKYGEGHMKKFHEKLNLTEDQKAKFKSVHEKYGERQKALYTKLKPLYEELKKEKAAQSVNYDRIRTLLKQTVDTRVELQIAHMQRADEIKQILTPEQQQQLKEMKKHHFKKRNR